MNIELVQLEGPAKTVDFDWDELPVSIGRGTEADLQLDDSSVSRIHCVIDQINGTLWVRDVGSTHGVFVNGWRAPQSHLMPGDKMSLGESKFRVEYQRRVFRPYGEVELALVEAAVASGW